MRKWIKKYDTGYFFLFVTVIFYYELIFRLFTVGGSQGVSTLVTAALSVGYGSVCYLLLSLVRKRKLRRILSGVVLLLTALPYIVQYLLYKQFKLFYDINTVTAGAQDALGSYSAEILHLLFAQKGIAVVLLLLFPFFIYLLPWKKFFQTGAPNWKNRLAASAVLLASLAAVFGIVFYERPLRLLVDEQYNYQAAVGSFGLLTGTGLDLWHQWAQPDYEFEADNTPEDLPVFSPIEDAPAEETPLPEEPEEAPVVYGSNVLDFDFEALNVDAPPEIRALNDYVKSLMPSRKNEYTGLFAGKNLIFISAEAFSDEVIDPERTPTLYRLATKGIRFNDYYQPSGAGTTGGEYQNVFGMIPTEGGKSFKNTAGHLNYWTMGSQLDRLGYYGKAYHNNSYTYYDRDITHNNIGYSDGFMGYGNGMEQYVQNEWPQSDYEMFKGTVAEYIDRQPFNIYYMTVSGHGNYTRGGNAMARRHWERVRELPYSEIVKGYLAANMELEDGLKYLVGELEARGIGDDTVICITADHFPYGLDAQGALGNMPYLSELYGMNVEDRFQRDHSCLIIWSGCLEEQEPIVVDTPVFSLDILPTLSNLFGTEFDSRLMVGRDVFSDAQPLVFNINYDWKTELGTYYASQGVFVPAEEGIVVPDGYEEQMMRIVRNKIKYSRGAAKQDYFRYLSGQ